jgi:hypothetical protein
MVRFGNSAMAFTTPILAKIKDCYQPGGIAELFSRNRYDRAAAHSRAFFQIW